MPFKNINEYADYRSEGAWHQASYIKTTGPIVGVISRWLDLSVGAGHPTYNAYGGTPLTATPLINTTNAAVYTGPTPSTGQTKHLHSLTVDTTSVSTPATFILSDYIMHYPFIDLDDTSEQTFTNTETLPRYTDGEGLGCTVVCLAPTSALNTNGVCTMNYINSQGASKSTTFSILGSTSVGSIMCSGNGETGATSSQASPFVPLAAGDSGIRSIQSITMSAGIGGLATFVICNPLASIPLFTNITQTEKTFFSRTGRAPQIENGAFLHFLGCINSTSVSFSTFRSSLTFVWG
jgi:hypothetical protein